MVGWVPPRSGLYNKVDARVTPGKKGKCKLTFHFREKMWPELKSFRVKGASLIPRDQVDKVMKTRETGPTSTKTLAAIKDIVEGWCDSNQKSYSGTSTRNLIAGLCSRLAFVDSVVITEELTFKSIDLQPQQTQLVWVEIYVSRGDLIPYLLFQVP
jgi:hypothetical protein